MSTSGTPAEKPRKTYEAGCHCGYIKFSVTLSPPLPENKPLNCDCSACRRFGYLLVYPPREDVEWHGDSWNRLSKYQFNTKRKDQLFCGKCGASLGIDFRDFFAPKEYPIGVNVRAINGIDLDALEYRPLKGTELVEPAGDLSGTQYELDQKDKAEGDKAEEKQKEADLELAVAAEVA